MMRLVRVAANVNLLSWLRPRIMVGHDDGVLSLLEMGEVGEVHANAICVLHVASHLSRLCEDLLNARFVFNETALHDQLVAGYRPLSDDCARKEAAVRWDDDLYALWGGVCHW